MNFFCFENNKYPYRELYLNDFSNVIISTRSLSSVLMNEDGTYTSLKAQHLDEKIFYFIEDEDIFNDETKLTRQISKAIC